MKIPGMDTKLRKLSLLPSLATLIFVIGSAQADDTVADRWMRG